MTESELIQAIDRMRSCPEEGQWFEFKTKRFDHAELGEALSGVYNGALIEDEPFAYVVYGIEDKTHDVKGTNLHSDQLAVGNEPVVFWLSKALDYPALEMKPIRYQEKHLVVFYVRINPATPLIFQNQHYYRVGGAIINISRRQELLRELYTKSKKSEPFEDGIADERLKAEEVLSLLNVDAYFNQSGVEKPKTMPELMEVLVKHGFALSSEELYAITNLGAILFANNLSHFGHLNGRRVRVIEYTGVDKQEGSASKGDHGYAIALPGLIKWLKEKLPLQPEQLIGARQVRLPSYPDRALREFIANALIHQDFSVSGINPTISIFSNRVEIRNAGLPELPTDRWIDEEKSRNEKLADRMLDMQLCERRGSGVDKALFQIEYCHLPAPKFIEGNLSTTVILPGPQQFRDMDKADRVRICYQHTCLQCVSDKKATNTTLRDRLGLSKDKHTIVSGIIGDTIEAGKIREADPTASKKFKSYLPWWA